MMEKRSPGAAASTRTSASSSARYSASQASVMHMSGCQQKVTYLGYDIYYEGDAHVRLPAEGLLHVAAADDGVKVGAVANGAVNVRSQSHDRILPVL